MPKPSLNDTQPFAGIRPGFTGVNVHQQHHQPMPQIPFPHPFQQPPFQQPPSDWIVDPVPPTPNYGGPPGRMYYMGGGPQRMPAYPYPQSSLPPPPPGLPPRPSNRPLPPPMGKFGNPRPPRPGFIEVIRDPDEPGGGGLNYG